MNHAWIGRPQDPINSPTKREEIERSGVFNIVEIKRYVWTVDYSADSYIDLLNTYSGHNA